MHFNFFFRYCAIYDQVTIIDKIKDIPRLSFKIIMVCLNFIILLRFRFVRINPYVSCLLITFGTLPHKYFIHFRIWRILYYYSVLFSTFLTFTEILSHKPHLAVISFLIQISYATSPSLYLFSCD